jgi:hypothetical protein
MKEGRARTLTAARPEYVVGILMRAHPEPRPATPSLVSP